MNSSVNISWAIVLISISIGTGNLGTKKEPDPGNDDGSKYVCKILMKTQGLDSCYGPKQIIESNKWKRLDYKLPIPGSIAVWTNYVAVIDPFQRVYHCSIGNIPIETLEGKLGAPEFYTPKKDTINSGK